MEKLYGVVINPVTDVRSEPKFKSERVHQLVFGEFVEILKEENDYVYASDIRLNYRGFINKHTLYLLTLEEYRELSRFEQVKISAPFCRTSGVISYMLPFGSRLYRDGDTFLLPDGRSYSLLDAPTVETKDVVEISLQFLGIPYLWGGTSSYGFDCSGFVNRLYDVLGIDIPRDANQQEEYLESAESPKSGDLLFMKGHVMLYMSENKVIHANGHHMCVSITDLEKEEYGRYLKSQVRKVGTIKSM
ncbi:MAG: SH3 domain-containing C40 family peptidase [Fervidobacterium sp.]|uniref:NlpC/P60 family protein n=1 Tax=Fervidobacterium gondwanense DSM 13020 TaxID=1121883 RepID=A0A1M7SL17_FERGO|nr:SH3 domain-containing C40 family peptidase [Fervidobacterium gondwanense]SHN59108.1 NlpC/P60 family protein [Fervidobacterium gondwanense DSM 13020]